MCRECEMEIAKTLMRLPDMTPELAKEMHLLMKGLVDVDAYPEAQRRTAECYHKPEWVDRVMHVLDGMLHGYGVEAINEVHESYFEFTGIEYVNMGDTYALTVMYDHRSGSWRVQSWGDAVENAPRRFE